MEKQFTDERNPVHKKNRRLLLRALIELAPKPTKHSRVTPVDVVRASMQQLANDEIWQYVCAMGKSGSRKVPMATAMAKIYRVVCVTACKVLSVTFREAGTAVSTFLKNTSNRAASKRHKRMLEERPQGTGAPCSGNGGTVNVSTGTDNDLSSSTETLSCDRSVQSNQKKRSFSRFVIESSSEDDLPASETSDFEHEYHRFSL